VWVRRLTHIFSRTVFNIFAAKSTENKSFRCFFEPLAGFEPPTSSLPNIYHLFFLVAAFRALLLGSVGITCAARFIYCSLL
jgi:hypothetical protein